MSLLGGLGDFLFGKPDYSKSYEYLSQIPGMEKGYLDPYIQRGQAAGAQLSQGLGQMARDPASQINALMTQYQQSPAFQRQRDEALQAMQSTGAATGRAGTSSELEREGALASSLASEDMQKWLSNVLGEQQMGYGGLQNLYGLGAQSSQRLAGDLSNVLGTQAQLAYGEEQARQKQMGGLLGGLMSLGGAFL